jgi:regulator of protease activity HflC (stomatin/prohibitin superfamily)
MPEQNVVDVSLLFPIIIVIVLVLFILGNAIRVLREYERGVVFRLGRLVGAKGPGLILLIPIIDKMVKVSLRTVPMDVPPQDVITRDNVTMSRIMSTPRRRSRRQRCVRSWDRWSSTIFCRIGRRSTPNYKR